MDAAPARVALCLENAPKISILHLCYGADEKEMTAMA